MKKIIFVLICLLFNFSAHAKPPDYTPQYCIINGTPVRSNPGPDGGMDILAYKKETGKFERNMNYLVQLAIGDDDGVTCMNTKDFYQNITRLKQEQKLPALNKPNLEQLKIQKINWAPTNDINTPYRTMLDDNELQIQVVGSSYTLSINGDTITSFSEWPATWNKPH